MTYAMDTHETTFEVSEQRSGNNHTFFDGVVVTTTASAVDTNDMMNHDNNTVFYPLVKQPTYMIVILSIAYGTVLVLALLGNTCVLAVVVKDKRFHSATYVFIANLAVADLLVALFCNPITLLSNIFNGESTRHCVCPKSRQSAASIS